MDGPADTATESRRRCVAVGVRTPLDTERDTVRLTVARSGKGPVIVAARGRLISPEIGHDGAIAIQTQQRESRYPPPEAG